MKDKMKKLMFGQNWDKDESPELGSPEWKRQRRKRKANFDKWFTFGVRAIMVMFVVVILLHIIAIALLGYHWSEIVEFLRGFQ